MDDTKQDTVTTNGNPDKTKLGDRHLQNNKVAEPINQIVTQNTATESDVYRKLGDLLEKSLEK